MAWQEYPVKDFSGGYVDKVDENLPQANQSPNCQNVICRKIGILEKRRGQKNLNASTLPGPVLGLYAYHYGANHRLVCASAGSVYYWDGAAFQLVKDGLNAQAPVEFVTCVNYMVGANGVDPPFKWDGTTVSALANAPVGRLPVLYKEQLFMVPQDDDSMLVWSEPFAPESWPAVNYWSVGKGDGDRITALVKHLGRLTIFKRYSVWTFAGTSLDDFSLTEKESNYGAVSQRAVVEHEMHLFYVSDDGIRDWNGDKSVNLTENVLPDLWDGLNKEYLHLACAGKWGGLLWFALPEGTATYNNLVLVFDPKAGAWWPWRGINASVFCRFDDGMGQKFYAGSSNSGYVVEQDTGFDDNGAAISAYWETVLLDIGYPEREKKFRRVYLSDLPGVAESGISVSADYSAFAPLSAVKDDGLVRRFQLSRKARYLKLRFEHNAAQNFRLRQALVEFKPKKVG